MANGRRQFEAVIDNDLPTRLPPVGSRLQLTGVYVGQGGNRVLGRPIDSFQLLLNSSANIQVVARAPWWTLMRLLTAVGILAGVLMVAVIWIKLLQRRVTERTTQLEGEIQERQQAVRQRVIEQERARVAHDLHDDLGARLTEVNMLTSLIKSPAISSEEKKHYLDELSETARQMVTSLDEIVWAVNPRNDTIASLASYFGAYAQRLLDLASIQCGLDVAEDLPDRPLDPKFRQEIFLAFKEALTNVLQHANATQVWLRISVNNNQLIVIIVDNGRGMARTEPPTGADGIANMKARLQVLDGRCDVKSDSKDGTTVRFEAPLPKSFL
jgi:signal transduction histidine kinase